MLPGLKRRGGAGVLLLAVAVLLAFAPGVQAAAQPGGGLRVKVLSCLTANTWVAAQRGCPTVPGAGYEGSQSSGLDEVTALATSGDGASLYAAGNRNSALTQLSAAGSPRSISFVSCLTGNSFLDDCTKLPGATSNAPEAPVSYPTAVLLSPDGRSLYVASGNFHASVIASFNRDPLTGALAYAGCVTGDLGAGPAGPAACTAIPSANREGYGSGLYEPSGLAISPDGRRLYVTAAGEGSVSRFARDPASGALSFVECLSSNRRASGCAHVPGGNPVLEGIGSPVLSSDGRFLFAAAGRADTVAAFALGASGALRFSSCITPRDDARPCRPGGRPEGPVAALSNPGGIAESPDGHFLYVSSTYGMIVALRRQGASGALSAVSCASSDSEDRGRCSQVPATRHRSQGAHHASLLTGVRTPLLTDARTLLAPVRTIDGLVRFRRDPQTGALAFGGCATGNLRLSTAQHGPCQPLPRATPKGTNSGFYKTTTLVPGPGNLLYAAASGDATVSLLRP